MCELKMTNNPCKYCNGEIDEGKPLCGDMEDLGDVCCMVKAKEGFDLEYWKDFECMHFFKINYCPMCGRNLKEADNGKIQMQ
jgi:hypothetical protein